MAIEDVGVAGDASMAPPSGTAAPSPSPASVVLDVGMRMPRPPSEYAITRMKLLILSKQCRSHYNGLKEDKKDLSGKLLTLLGFYITFLAIAFVGSIGEKPNDCKLWFCVYPTIHFFISAMIVVPIFFFERKLKIVKVLIRKRVRERTDLDAQYGAMCVLHLEAELGDVEIAECLAFADTERNTEVIRCELEVMAAYAFSVVLLGFTLVGMVVCWAKGCKYGLSGH